MLSRVFFLAALSISATTATRTLRKNGVCDGGTNILSQELSLRTEEAQLERLMVWRAQPTAASSIADSSSSATPEAALLLQVEQCAVQALAVYRKGAVSEFFRQQGTPAPALVASVVGSHHYRQSQNPRSRAESP